MKTMTKLLTGALLALSLATAAHAADDNASVTASPDSATVAGTDRGGSPQGTDRGGSPRGTDRGGIPGGVLVWLMQCIGNAGTNR